MWNIKIHIKTKIPYQHPKTKIVNSKYKKQNWIFKIQKPEFKIELVIPHSKLKIQNLRLKLQNLHTLTWVQRFVISDVFPQLCLLSTYARDEKVQC